MPVRRDRRLRQQAERAGHLLRGQRVDVLAVEQHRARGRLQHPGQGTQQGGLAARVGADDHGERAVGDRHRQVPGDDPLVVGEGHAVGRAVGSMPAASCRCIRRAVGARPSYPARPVRRPAATAGRPPPSTPVTTPTGSWSGAEGPLRGQVGGDQQRRAHQAAAAGRRRAPRVSRRASCGATSATKATGPAAAVADGGEQHGRREQQPAGRARPGTPRACAVSSPISIIRSARARAASTQRHQHGAAAPSSGTLVPAAPVEAAGQPETARAASIGVGPGEQVAVDGGEHRGEPDADQDQPVAVHAAPPGQQVDRQRR